MVTVQWERAKDRQPMGFGTRGLNELRHFLGISASASRIRKGEWCAVVRT